MPKPLTDRERSFLYLIDRSPEAGDGWRVVSRTCWQLVIGFTRPELIEIDGNSKTGGLVRFTERGLIVKEYV